MEFFLYRVLRYVLLIQNHLGKQFVSLFWSLQGNFSKYPSGANIVFLYFSLGRSWRHNFGLDLTAMVTFIYRLWSNIRSIVISFWDIYRKIFFSVRRHTKFWWILAQIRLRGEYTIQILPIYDRLLLFLVPYWSRIMHVQFLFFDYRPQEATPTIAQRQACGIFFISAHEGRRD